LGWREEEAGQSRVPEPPARIRIASIGGLTVDGSVRKIKTISSKRDLLTKRSYLLTIVEILYLLGDSYG
jgi:hypothetical protein